MAEQIASFQKGRTLATVSFKHSVKGKTPLGTFLYLGSNLGCLSIFVFLNLVLPWVIFFKSCGRDIITSSPDLNLSFTVLGSSLRFVQSLESTIMSFIKSPGSDNREVVASKLIGSNVVGLDSSSKNRGEDNIKFESSLLEVLSGFSSFSLT